MQIENVPGQDEIALSRKFGNESYVFELLWTACNESLSLVIVGKDSVDILDCGYPRG